MTIRWLVTEADPDISVVVPTLPEHRLQGSAELKNQSSNSYEVLVVRDSSLDICEARNTGIEAATAEFVALTDDDTRPPNDWVSTALDRLRRGVALVEGPILKVYDGRNDTEFRDNRWFETASEVVSTGIEILDGVIENLSKECNERR